MRVLETERLWLRPYRLEDLERMAPLYADHCVTAFTKLGRRTPAETGEILEGYLATWRALGLGMRALFLKPGAEYVGEFGLFELTSPHDLALRYALARPYWGRGLTTEAARVTLDDAFGAQALERVRSIVQTRNAASRRVMERLGFRVERKGRDGDVEIIVYVLERGDWRRAQA